MTALEFIKKNGLEILEPVFLYTQQVQGGDWCVCVFFFFGGVVFFGLGVLWGLIMMFMFFLFFWGVIILGFLLLHLFFEFLILPGILNNHF